MGKYNFDEVIDRHGTDCLKYDFGMKRKGRDDLLPLWVADMDFRLPDEILDEFHKRIDQHESRREFIYTTKKIREKPEYGYA